MKSEIFSKSSSRVCELSGAARGRLGGKGRGRPYTHTHTHTHREHVLCIHAHREETQVFQWNVCGMRKCAAARSGRELTAGKVRVNLISAARENDSLVHLSMLSLSSSQ